MKTAWVCALVVFLVAACASKPPMVLDESRPAVQDRASVIVFNEMPQGATEISVVRASSRSRDSAIAKLGQEAAKVGANAVVLESSWSEKDVASTSRDGAYTNHWLEIVKGIAVIVDE